MNRSTTKRPDADKVYDALDVLWGWATYAVAAHRLTPTQAKRVASSINQLRLEVKGDLIESPRAHAMLLLRARLAKGPVAARTLMREAARQHISEKTLRRAAKGLHVVMRQRAANGRQYSTWALLVPETV
ncbi:MAG TPA: hypothetical protein VJN62_02315 [Gemmatimonadales bacterium]|nr:hypothetical protein [Gemmatimonadales bacterium]